MATDNESSLKTEKTGDGEGSIQDEESEEYDEEERRSREKLKRWQEKQAVKSFIDNTVNRVLEGNTTPSIGGSTFRFFRGISDMENTAVMMAIRNHGLLQPVDSEKSPSCSSSGSSYSSVGSSTDQVHPAAGGSGSSADFESFCAESGINRQDGLAGDQRSFFLECAIAEAIKKKGLSALREHKGTRRRGKSQAPAGSGCP